MTTPEAVGVSAGRLDRIRDAMQAHIRAGTLPGIVAMVARRGEIVFSESFGWMDIEAGKPMQEDAICRLASLTKPVTSVAALVLYEEGLFQLSDPVSRFLPEFRDSKVFAGDSSGLIQVVDAKRPITIGDLLTFVSGLIQGFGEDQPLKEVYEAADLSQDESTLEQAVLKIADLPLLHQPGLAWRYGVSYDVLARLIEVVSGMSFADFLHQRVFKPLGMNDTGFYVPSEKREQLSAAYNYDEHGRLIVCDAPATSSCLIPPRLTTGSGNLVGTAPDYMRFAQMLLNGGELEGTRLLSRKTVEFMTMNHLPQELLPIRMAPDIAIDGYGYGLGVRVLLDVAQTQILGSQGEYGWAGYWSTTFWVDPKEELVGIFFTQVGPLYCFPHVIPPDFKTLVYQTLVD